ncbi:MULTISPECIES: type II toxin-antitoxin system Phd/YefM family antitoxin [unclassified Luteococcus]|uniref:type II toxin-antitoxin system Phd/YefM family antitoxin n=1 Tax=unclassified Luteococcus TaxID=2639923 RepID=UPI00313B71B9
MTTAARAEIGSYEAKTHLPRLLDEVEAGASYTITKHGRPVAKLVPIKGGKRDPEEVKAAFARLRASIPPDPTFDIKAAIEEGRR